MCVFFGLTMMRKQMVIFTLMILLFAAPSYATESKDTEQVEKFGVGFDDLLLTLCRATVGECF